MKLGSKPRVQQWQMVKTHPTYSENLSHKLRCRERCCFVFRASKIWQKNLNENGKKRGGPRANVCICVYVKDNGKTLLWRTKITGSIKDANFDTENGFLSFTKHLELYYIMRSINLHDCPQLFCTPCLSSLCRTPMPIYVQSIRMMLSQYGGSVLQKIITEICIQYVCIRVLNARNIALNFFFEFNLKCSIDY